MGGYTGIVTSNHVRCNSKNNNKIHYPVIGFFSRTEFTDELDVEEKDGLFYHNKKIFSGVIVAPVNNEIQRYCWIKSGLRDGPELLLDAKNQLRSLIMYDQGMRSGVAIDFSDNGISKLMISGILKPNLIEKKQYFNGRVDSVFSKDNNGKLVQKSLSNFEYIIPYQPNYTDDF